MVVGGGTENRDEADTVELISLDPADHPVPSCLRNLSAFPVPLTAAAGGSFLTPAGASDEGNPGEPVVCGGYGTGERLLSCYKYKPSVDRW